MDKYEESNIETKRTELLSTLATLASEIAGRRNNRTDDNFIVPTFQSTMYSKG
jgi:hypothetical protein